MTIRQLIACASPLSDGHTVGEHLAATDCGSLAPPTEIIIINPIINQCDVVYREEMFNVYVPEDKQILVDEIKVYAVDADDIYVDPEDININESCH